MIAPSARVAGRGSRRGRRGSALVLVLVMAVALAALALSAIYLSSHATLVGKAFDREREYRYAAEAALAIGRSRLSTDASLVLDDSLPTQLLTSGRITGADGRPLPGVALNLWVARSGSKTGEWGQYASVIAEARDSTGGGAKFIRRLELMEENFARFLDWSDRLARPGCYGAGEVMDGPVWSNANICDLGGRFRDTVATAGIVSPAIGVYEKGRLINQRSMALPDVTRLERLQTYAASGNFLMSAPSGPPGATNAHLRIEFVWWDLNGDGDAVGPEDEPEGFLRVYENDYPMRLRADYVGTGGDWIANRQCGDWHWMNGRLMFFPVEVHGQSWFRTAMRQTTNREHNRTRPPYYSTWTSNSAVDAHATTVTATLRTQIMRHTRTSSAKTASAITPRCFPAGDPHLAAVERHTSGGYGSAQIQIGGEDTTFTPSSPSSLADGRWRPWPGPAVDWSTFSNPPPTSMRPYLWPIDRGLNPGTKGVVYVNGSVALHGTLRGRLTVYATGDVTFVDDVRYSVDPSSAEARDMLGVIAAGKVTIADNAINTPQDPYARTTAGDTWMDDDMHFYLHGVVMALDTFVPENWNAGPGNMSTCNGYNIGRGCLYQVGGAIVRNREVTYNGSTRTGYMESRTYDTRMSRASPPYFPTTGRYFDNRFYEVDPQGFDITTYLRRIGQRGP